jgi:flagellar biosynthesis protein FlhB
MAALDQNDTDRTEDPTQKRLDEALERGDVVKSQEVSTWFVIAGGGLVLAAFSGSMDGRGLKRIITNPTHFAVALRYERGMNAPVCVAKGVDALALKIREVAGEHSIPAVENPPLARALHATVDIDQEIPAEHYKAVAEVIGYVMKLRRAPGRA